MAALQINGATMDATDRGVLTQLFGESMYAAIPLGTHIRKSFNGDHQEMWEYPVGTEVAHQILFRDVAHTLFELRLIRKVSENQWDFATYSPADQRVFPNALRRNHYTGLETVNRKLVLTSGSNAAINLKRINLASCRNCHYASTIARQQYPDVASTGPCGFTPGNTGIITWIQAWATQHGSQPF